MAIRLGDPNYPNTGISSPEDTNPPIKCFDLKIKREKNEIWGMIQVSFEEAINTPVYQTLKRIYEKLNLSIFGGLTLFLT